jgi:hypothetical protein
MGRHLIDVAPLATVDLVLMVVTYRMFKTGYKLKA